MAPEGQNPAGPGLYPAGVQGAAQPWASHPGNHTQLGAATGQAFRERSGGEHFSVPKSLPQSWEECTKQVLNKHLLKEFDVRHSLLRILIHPGALPCKAIQSQNFFPGNLTMVKVLFQFRASPYFWHLKFVTRSHCNSLISYKV